MKEDDFVGIALSAAQEIVAPPLSVVRGAALLYQITVDNRLIVRVKPRKPVRGQSAFQTDLCVFEEVCFEEDSKDVKVQIPRVVMEFKPGLSSHDVITYSAKARKHKNVYPYLRYGLVIANEATIPGRFFIHNAALDFCIAAKSYRLNRVHEIFASILGAEIATSRQLEAIAFGQTAIHTYRSEILVHADGGKLV
ncbi:MAG: hypothetical protein M3R52_06200 [Acidobacteriota bacterium]|nr:hypothetical protein [Acidobacteriota bacterium]